MITLHLADGLGQEGINLSSQCSREAKSLPMCVVKSYFVVSQGLSPMCAKHPPFIKTDNFAQSTVY